MEPPVNNTPAIILPGPIDLLKEAWSFYKKTLKTQLLISLFEGGMYLVVFGIFAGGAFYAASQMKDGGTLPLPVIIIGVILGFILFILVEIISAWNQLCRFSLVKNNGGGWKKAYQDTKPLLLSYFGVAILLGLISFGGFFLFVVPGLIFAFWFSQATYIVFDEKKKGFEALLTSREYVRGKFWPIVGRGFAISLLMGLAQLPFSIIESILKNVHASEVIGSIISLMGSGLSFFVLTPLTVIYLYLLYTYVKKQHGPISITIAKSTKIKYALVSTIGILFFIGIFSLAGFGVMTAFKAQTATSNDTMRMTRAYSIQTALDQYYIEKGEYPMSLSDLSPDYLKVIPVDPVTSAPFTYNASDDGQSFSLCVNYQRYPNKCIKNSQGNTNDQVMPELSPMPSYPSL